jgi:hypothetical protein
LKVLMPPPQPRVPIRTIAATIGMVLLTAAVLSLAWEVRRVLTWIVVAVLLADEIPVSRPQPEPGDQRPHDVTT